MIPAQHLNFSTERTHEHASKSKHKKDSLNVYDNAATPENKIITMQQMSHRNKDSLERLKSSTRSAQDSKMFIDMQSKSDSPKKSKLNFKNGLTSEKDDTNLLE